MVVIAMADLHHFSTYRKWWGDDINTLVKFQNGISAILRSSGFHVIVTNFKNPLQIVGDKVMHDEIIITIKNWCQT